MSSLAIGAIAVVAGGMWVYFQIHDRILLRDVPAAVRQEIMQLREHPGANAARLWTLIEQYYPIEHFMPELSNPDWMVVGLLAAGLAPFLVLFGIVVSRTLTRQFEQVARSARRVAGGDFRVRATVDGRPPREIVELTADFNDMTARLEQYERELRESSAMMAHELRTPLNAAMGRVQGMMDDVFPRDATQLALVLRQLEQINRLVGDLHLLSLARAGQLRLEMERFDLAQLVHERRSWLEPAMNAAGLQVTTRCQSGLLMVGDRDRIGQVMLALMENALRYAASGGVLEIRAVQAGEHIELTLADRGPGVPEEDLAHLRDRFWRADRSRARLPAGSGGSGLGLAIADAICQAHGGTLVFSAREGGGLQAVATLPRQGQREARASG